jgi:hypothetical protein
VADIAMLILLRRPTPRLNYIQKAIDAHGQPRDALQSGICLTPLAERIQWLLTFANSPSTDPDGYNYAMGVFAELREQAVPILWRYLDPAVIAAQDVLIAWDAPAVHVLARLGDTGVVPKLLEFLMQTRGELRVQVIEDLAFLRDRAAVVPLSPCLQDRDTEVQAAAIKALGELGDARALPALAQVQRQNAAPGNNPRRLMLLDLATQAIARIKAQEP